MTTQHSNTGIKINVFEPAFPHPLRKAEADDLREFLTALYYHYTDGYLTTARFAEHNGLYPDEAVRLLALCRDVIDRIHPEM